MGTIWQRIMYDGYGSKCERFELGQGSSSIARTMKRLRVLSGPLLTGACSLAIIFPSKHAVQGPNHRSALSTSRDVTRISGEVLWSSIPLRTLLDEFPNRSCRSRTSLVLCSISALTCTSLFSLCCNPQGIAYLSGNYANHRPICFRSLGC